MKRFLRMRKIEIVRQNERKLEWEPQEENVGVNRRRKTKRTVGKRKRQSGREKWGK